MKKISILLCLLMLGCKNDSSEKNILSILLSKDSQLEYEEYFNGGHKDQLVNIQSISKSIITILIGQAIDEGLIESEDEPISKYFPDIADHKNSITIRHLLNHTSGIEWKGYLEHEAFKTATSQTEYVLGKELQHKPGEVYNYNSGGTHLLSVILSTVSAKSTLEYAHEKLFDPLNINMIEWGKLNGGYHDGAGFSLKMLPTDLIKIGELLLTEKTNEQVVSKSWKDKMLNHKLKKNTKWGLRNSTHGYGWYAANKGKILYSMGYGGQFILVHPEKNMIIVSTHNHDTPDGIDQQVDFLNETLPILIDKYGS